MDHSAFFHIPTSLIFSDARLFWLLAHEFYRAGLVTECDQLLREDWSNFTLGEDAEDIASKLSLLFFAKDDLPRLQNISEGFEPAGNALYFKRLRDFGRKNPQAKKCLGWMQSQKLIGKGLDGFKEALLEGLVDLARSLYLPNPAESEATFFELAPFLTKEAAGLLLFQCPSLADAHVLAKAVQAKAQEDVLCFLAWKIEGAHDKNHLRHPHGDDKLLPFLMATALCRKQFSFAKKILDWDHSLAFERIAPKELAPPWDQDASLIKLDGSLSLTPSDFSCLYAHEGFARALGHLQAPAPSLPKIKALLGPFSKKLESRRPGQGIPWATQREAAIDALAKSVWNDI